jgi:hypothetical protein
MKKTLFTTLTVIGSVLYQLSASAQCAMCKATAESATDNVSKGIGEGLNSGIVYLMVIPYLLLGTVAIVFFRKKIAGLFKAQV